MRIKLKIIIVFFISVFFANIGDAQIAYSPYSLFGAGQIENRGFGAIKALGGTGIAFLSKNTLNNINPASYNGIDSLNFLYEIGISFNTTSFTSGNKTQNRNDGNIQYIAIGLRLSKSWAISIGLMPYSKVDYIISTTDHINGENISFDKTFTGNGGINKFYIGNSFRLTKNLVLGVNASVLFGTITKIETAVESTGFSGYSFETKQYVNALYLDYGIQYSFKLKENKFTFGAIYGSRKKLNTSSDIDIYTTDYNASIDDDDSKTFEIPQKIGLGLAFNKKDKWKVGFDYEKRDWGLIEYSNPLLKTRNSERFSAGFEASPDRNSSKKGLNKLYYRLGANYNKSYLVINNIPINSFAFTAGVGIPIKKQLNMINVSLEYGQNGTLQDGLMKEKYWKLNLSLSLRDKWFQQRKYY